MSSYGEEYFKRATGNGPKPPKQPDPEAVAELVDTVCRVLSVEGGLLSEENETAIRNALNNLETKGGE